MRKAEETMAARRRSARSHTKRSVSATRTQYFRRRGWRNYKERAKATIRKQTWCSRTIRPQLNSTWQRRWKFAPCFRQIDPAALTAVKECAGTLLIACSLARVGHVALLSHSERLRIYACCLPVERHCRRVYTQLPNSGAAGPGK